MTNTVRAPQRSSRAATAAAAARPLEHALPPLRVVDETPAPDPGDRRTPFGALGVVLVGCLFIAVFGMVVFQALLVQTQSRLDTLGEQVGVQEARGQMLDRQRADLESPERIVAAAQRLNMVKPADRVYLQPGASDDVQAAYDPNAPAPRSVTPTTKASPPKTAPVPTTAPKTATTKATTPATKAGTPTTKATTPTTTPKTATTRATAPTTKAKTATTRATATR
jgi:hypothetical protein